MVREAVTDADDDDDDDAVADETKKLIDIASDTEKKAAVDKSAKPVGKPKSKK